MNSNAQQIACSYNNLLNINHKAVLKSLFISNLAKRKKISSKTTNIETYSQCYSGCFKSLLLLLLYIVYNFIVIPLYMFYII